MDLLKEFLRLGRGIMCLGTEEMIKLHFIFYRNRMQSCEEVVFESKWRGDFPVKSDAPTQEKDILYTRGLLQSEQFVLSVQDD